VTSSLIASFDALAVLDAQAAKAIVKGWRREPMLWNALARGVSGDLEAHLARFA
jgi:hypothetical protein